MSDSVILRLRRLSPGAYVAVGAPVPVTLVAGKGKWTVTIGDPKKGDALVQSFGNKKTAKQWAEDELSREDLIELVSDKNWRMMGAQKRGVDRTGFCNMEEHDRCASVAVNGTGAQGARFLCCACECHTEARDWTTDRVREAVKALVEDPSSLVGKPSSWTP